MQMKYHEHVLGTQRFLPLGTRFHFLLPLDSALRTGADIVYSKQFGVSIIAELNDSSLQYIAVGKFRVCSPYGFSKGYKALAVYSSQPVESIIAEMRDSSLEHTAACKSSARARRVCSTKHTR